MLLCSSPASNVPASCNDVFLIDALAAVAAVAYNALSFDRRP